MRDADVLLVIGDRLSEITTGGYTLLGVPRPAQALVHVNADPDELGRVYSPTLAIVASPDAFALALAELPPLEPRPWRGGDAAGAMPTTSTTCVTCPAPGDLDMGEVMAIVRSRLPRGRDPHERRRQLLGLGAPLLRVPATTGTQLAPTSGAMGYGVPAAVAAKLLHPERTVVCIAGDGDFLMTGQELATAVQYDAAIVVLVVNNGMYGTIRMHQERHYPGRVSRHRPRQPRLRGARTVVRCARCRGRAHGGLRRRASTTRSAAAGRR